MKLENQVCSLELSRKLKELGVKQGSVWVWQNFGDQKKKIWRLEKSSGNMKKTFYKKGQQIDFMSVAGKDMWKYEAFGVWADVFIKGDEAQIPVVFSKNQGQGNFKKWLDEMEKEFKRIQFNTIINQRLAEYLKRRGYKTLN